MPLVAKVQQPSVGRIVHVVGTDATGTPECQAAIITSVVDPAGEAGGGIITAVTFPPPGSLAVSSTEELSHVDAEHAVVLSWHWPERV